MKVDVPRGREAAAAVLLLASSIGGAACGGAPSTTDTTKLACVGMEFTVIDRDPGRALVDGYPIFNKSLGDARPMQVGGVIIEGTNTEKQEPLKNIAQGISFRMSWNPESKQLQKSTISASVQFLGNTMICPPVTMAFNSATGGASSSPVNLGAVGRIEYRG